MVGLINSQHTPMQKFHAPCLLAMALLAVLGGAASVASAAPLSFLNDTLTARFPAKDLPAFRSTVAEVLRSSPDNELTQWEGRHGAPQRHFKVALTPLQTTHTQKAGTCRLLDLQVSQGRSVEPWKFWFCQQADGSWKASGTTAPR
jgi:hypothetical protein